RPRGDPPRRAAGARAAACRRLRAGSAQNCTTPRLEPKRSGAHPKDMKSNIDIPESGRASVVDILNRLLSDEYVLLTKTRNYHWNVTGPQFNDLHKFFEGQYDELNEIVDEVAERARQLDGRAFGTLAEFAKSSRL